MSRDDTCPRKAESTLWPCLGVQKDLESSRGKTGPKSCVAVSRLRSPSEPLPHPHSWEA